MRVVVTGAGGNVGRHVVAALASRGHEVAAVDRVDRPADVAATSSWTVGDVGDPVLMARVMASARPDALVHLAAIPRPSLGTPLEVFATNTQATFVALETAGDAGVARVAIASSTSALGMVFARRPVSPLYVPVDEAHPFVGSDIRALEAGRRGDRGDDAAPARLPGRRAPDLEHVTHAGPDRARGPGREGPGRVRQPAVGLPRRAGRGPGIRARGRAGPARLSRDQRDGPGYDLARAHLGPAGALPSDIRHQAPAARRRGPV